MSTRRRRNASAPQQLALPLGAPLALVAPLAPAPVAAADRTATLRAAADVLGAGEPIAAVAALHAVAVATDAADDWAALLAVLCDDGAAAPLVPLATALRARFAAVAAIQFGCGVAFHRERLFGEAAAAYAAALVLDDGLVDAHRHLFECYEALGQLPLAIRHGSAWRRASNAAPSRAR